MRATGKVRVSASLGDMDRWKTLPPRGGTTRLADGPYVESEEMIGGVFIIQANGEKDAQRIAAMHPAATIWEAGGWSVELGPLDLVFRPRRVAAEAASTVTISPVHLNRVARAGGERNTTSAIPPTIASEANRSRRFRASPSSGARSGGDRGRQGACSAERLLAAVTMAQVL